MVAHTTWRSELWRFRIGASWLAILALAAGCSMPIEPAPDAPRQPETRQPQPTAATCNGTPAQTRVDWQYLASVEDDFTGYERRTLDKLHAEGWNGEGVAIVVNDEFNADGSPSHGEAVLNIARYYAPNALFIRSSKYTGGARFPPDEYLARDNPVYVLNSSFGGMNDPGTVDALPVEQSGTTSPHVVEVWAAGNVQRALGNGPADAVPAIEHNLLVYLLGLAYDFDELMHSEEPCTGEQCRNGLLHAKSGRWLQPGGHADGESSLASVALREATEETGITGLEVWSLPVDIDVHLFVNRKRTEPDHLHFDVRFLIRAPQAAVVRGNHESEGLRWVAPDELADPELDLDASTRRLARHAFALARSLR